MKIYWKCSSFLFCCLIIVPSKHARVHSLLCDSNYSHNSFIMGSNFLSSFSFFLYSFIFFCHPTFTKKCNSNPKMFQNWLNVIQVQWHEIFKCFLFIYSLLLFFFPNSRWVPNRIDWGLTRFCTQFNSNRSLSYSSFFFF